MHRKEEEKEQQYFLQRDKISLFFSFVKGTKKSIIHQGNLYPRAIIEIRNINIIEQE